MFAAWRRHILLLGLLGFFSSMLTGIGIGAVVPLLSFLINQQAGKDPGTIGNLVVKFLSFFSLPYSLTSLLLVIIGLFLTRAAFLFFFSYLDAKIRAEYRASVLETLFHDLFLVKWEFFISQKQGIIHDILIRDTDSGAKLLGALANFILSFTTALVLFSFAYLTAPQVTIFSAVAGIAFLIIFRPLVKKTRIVGKSLSMHGKNVSQLIAEHTSGLKAIKSSSVEDSVYRRGFKLFEDRKSLEIKRTILASLSYVSVEPMSIIFIASAFAVSYTSSTFNFEVFAATLFLIHRIFINLGSGQSSLHMINELLPAAIHLSEFKNYLKVNMETNVSGMPFAFRDVIAFDDVSFSYLRGNVVLKSVNLKIKNGELAAIIGPSGAGKTSIADIFLRMIDPLSGRVLLDGKDARDYALREWRNSIGYVSQDIFLLNDTVYNNIAFYNARVSKKDIEEASKKANIFNFIQTLPEKFETIVGERGIMLSAGQRQRIVLARVLVRSPDILILDEATSALDNESEVLIQKAIEALRGKITVVIIAHRLSTVVNADKILVLDQGRIVEEGSPQTLLNDANSYFFRMYNLKKVA